jgi:hypothetical protein
VYRMAPGDALNLNRFGILYWGGSTAGMAGMVVGSPSGTVLSSSSGPPPLGLTLTFFVINSPTAELVGMVQ